MAVATFGVVILCLSCNALGSPADCPRADALFQLLSVLCCAVLCCAAGSPGLEDPAARADRAARDDAFAAALRLGGLHPFVGHWYQLPMWEPLRASPRFPALLQQRQGRGDAEQLAAVLAAASPGRAPNAWRELQAAAAAGSLPPLLLVAGQEDAKFVGLAERLAASLAPAGSDDNSSAGAATAAPAAQVALVPSCGHAVHIERPAELLALLQRFSTQCGAPRP